MLCAAPGCSVLVGNVKPVEERDTTYQVLRLSTEVPAEWKLLDRTQGRTPDESDLAFQSRKTGAIISLNSVCRSSYLPKGGIDSLRQFSRQLLLGSFDQVLTQAEMPRQVDGIEALETRMTGTVPEGKGEKAQIRVVVVKKDRCVYDLMLLGRPETIARSEADFDRFVGSLRFEGSTRTN